MQKMHVGKSIEDYKSDFPDAPIMCEKFRQQISVNSGKHMKMPKYRKLFSESIKGENNPNHKCNTTEEQRKSRSPFSKRFYEVRNLSETDRQIFINNILKLKHVESFNTHIEFYLNKGLSIEDAKLALSKRQHTYKGGKFSKMCQNFINDVLGENINSENFLFGKNELNLKDKEHNTHYMYDLTNTKTKCIIEFNGDFWHGNPAI